MTDSINGAIRNHQKVALAIVLTGFGGLGGWAAVASVSGAVVAPAVVVVENNAKKVQHLDGGLIAETIVKNGDRLAAGDIIVRLDDTEARANLQIFQSQLSELKARMARLVAERDGLSVLDVTANNADAPVSIWQSQAKLLAARLDVRRGKKQQLSEQIAQLEQATKGLAAQASSKEKQIALIHRELISLYKLRAAELVTQSRWLALERETARLEGERGQLTADIARSGVQIAETRLQLIGVDQVFLSEVLSELREVETKVNELSEKVAAIRARLKRMDIRSPMAGVVHKLTATTVGGVIGPGEIIAEVVPEKDHLVLEGRVDPGSIDRLHLAQSTIARFPTFDVRKTPEFNGKLIMISPDARQDAPDQPAYYMVRVALTGSEESPSSSVLKPGMPAELLFETGDRSVLSYLIKPVSDQFAHAMRER